tara:strand:- start:1842 stop:2021 length:180 start_codon:yes stop_codon:yes gene_type:complete
MTNIIGPIPSYVVPQSYKKSKKENHNPPEYAQTAVISTIERQGDSSFAQNSKKRYYKEE